MGPRRRSGLAAPEPPLGWPRAAGRVGPYARGWPPQRTNTRLAPHVYRPRSQTVIAIAAAAQPDEAPTTTAVKNAMVIIHPSCAGPFSNDLLRGSFPDVLQAAQSRAAAEVAFAATRADVVRVQAGPHHNAYRFALEGPSMRKPEADTDAATTTTEAKLAKGAKK